ncbi:DNA-binding protein [Desulfomarina sp.]
MTFNTTGKIVETMDSGGYTYILVDNGKEKTWVAIPLTKVEKGTTVTYNSGMVMTDFVSKSLNRTFSTIVFSSGLTGKGNKSFHGMAKSDDSFAAAVQSERKAAPPAASRPVQSSGGSSGAIAPFREINVTKANAPNGYTVEELYSQADKLNGQKVVLHGLVVKVSPNIMGRNWIHMQDGTGNPMKNSHDMVVTSSELPEVNSEITIEGVLAAKKDFGAGYKYRAIIEKAKIK